MVTLPYARQPPFLSFSDPIIKICLHNFPAFDTISTHVFRVRFIELACNLFYYLNLIYLAEILICFRILVAGKDQQNKLFRNHSFFF